MTRNKLGQFVKKEMRPMSVVRAQTNIVTTSMLGILVMLLEMYVV